MKINRYTPPGSRAGRGRAALALAATGSLTVAAVAVAANASSPSSASSPSPVLSAAEPAPARAAAAAAAAAAFAAPADAPTARSATPIPSHYIVVLNDGRSLGPAQVRAAAEKLTKNRGGTVTRTYRQALRGFAVKASPAQARRLAGDPAVAYVEQDRMVRAVDTQPGATWGLDRVDQRRLPLDRSYGYTTRGSGVTAYVIDTGIRTSHNDFGGRASVGTDTVRDGRNGQDAHGHGTHVAGTIGGATWGVAKGVRLVSVRVLGAGGSGSTSGVIAGIDWVTRNAAKPAVANMSLGGAASPALDAAVRASIASGVTYAIAAGNSNADACRHSPARTAQALTVGATGRNDARASFSNYGRCLDLFAPGVGITSAVKTSDTATATYSGTSMAAPHVAGVAALYLGVNTGASPATVAGAITGDATTQIVGSPGKNSPNRLLYSRYAAGGAVPSPTPTPTPTPTVSSPPTRSFFRNTADLALSPRTPAVVSPIKVTGRSGKGPAALRVAVNVKYRDRGALAVNLRAPNGRMVPLKRQNPADRGIDLNADYRINATALPAAGTWRLYVSASSRSRYSGYLDNWSLRF